MPIFGWWKSVRCKQRREAPLWPSCTVYMRDEAILVFPHRGNWRPLGDPVTKVENDVDNQALGNAILAALEQSQISESALAPQDTLRSVGFRSFGEVERGALMLDVRRSEAGYHVSAWAASPGGHDGVPDGEKVCSGEPSELGGLVRELSRLCTPRLSNSRLKSDSARIASGEYDPDDVPNQFGYKMCWIAVPSTDWQALVECLKLQQVERCSWTKGFQRAYEKYDGVFVTPPVGGWTLALGRLPEAAVELAEFIAFLEMLSDKFGKAYYFGTHRVAGYHVWAVAEQGAMKRVFGYGNDFVDIGERTPEERELGIGVNDGEHWPDEEDVLNMAARWVLDPRDLDLEVEACGPGWYGGYGVR